MAFNQDSFNRFVISSNVIEFPLQTIRQHSGRTTPFYVNWRNAIHTIDTQVTLVRYIIDYINDTHIAVDSFVGIPQGASELGSALQHSWAKTHPTSNTIVQLRVQPKPHGDPAQQYFVSPAYGAVVLIEDTVTTGTSLEKGILPILALSKEQATLSAIIALTDRNELTDGIDVATRYAQRGIAYHSLSSALELLPLAFEHYNINENCRREIATSYRNQYGQDMLKF